MTLRLRVLLGLGLVAVVLVVAGVVVTRSTRADLVAKVDEQLRTVARPRPAGDLPARPGAPGAGLDPDGLALSRSTVWFGRVTDGSVRTLVAPLTADGETASPDLSAAEVTYLVDHPDEPITVDGDGADRFRVLAQSSSGTGTTLVGAPLDDVDASSRRLVAVEVGATVAMLALLGLVAFWVLRLGVRPVKQMAAAAGAIAAGDLSRRVPEADPRTEAGELGAALNSMLNHIEDAFRARAASEDRLRRFVADASHELRTPITTIRGYAELSRRGGLDDPAEREAAMARTEQEAVRMGVLVDDLLLLARLDQGRPLLREPVDLARIVRDAAADAAVSHPDHAVEVHVDLPPATGAADPARGRVGSDGRDRSGGAGHATPAEGRPAAGGPTPGAGPDPAGGAAGGSGVVTGDDHRLRQVVGNLVANAVAHTPPGTSVDLSLGVDPADPTRLLLAVADDGPGMEPELAARAFERFARGDVARSRAAGSTGLGLSIVAAIVAAHDGTVTLHSAPGEGTSVRVSLPRRGGEAPGPGAQVDTTS